MSSIKILIYKYFKLWNCRMVGKEKGPQRKLWKECVEMDLEKDGVPRLKLKLLTETCCSVNALEWLKINILTFMLALQQLDSNS